MAVGKRKVPLPPSDEKKKDTSHREKMITRLRHIAGSKFTTSDGAEGWIEEFGVFREDKGRFFLYSVLTDEQIAEIMRCNEEFIKHTDDRAVTKEHVMERIENRKALGENTEIEERMAHWLFGDAWPGRKSGHPPETIAEVVLERFTDGDPISGREAIQGMEMEKKPEKKDDSWMEDDGEVPF